MDRDSTALLQQAVRAAQSGDREQARSILTSLLGQDWDNERAWLWMAYVSHDEDERVACLENVLRINPANEQAQQWLSVAHDELARTHSSSAGATRPAAPPRPSVVAEQPAAGRPLPPPGLDTGPTVRETIGVAWAVGATGLVLGALGAFLAAAWFPDADPLLLTSSPLFAAFFFWGAYWTYRASADLLAGKAGSPLILVLLFAALLVVGIPLSPLIFLFYWLKAHGK